MSASNDFNDSTASLLKVEEFVAKSVTCLDYSVCHDELFESCRVLLGMVFPDWDLDKVDFTQCKDGITNKLMKCINKAKDQTVLIRAYGKKSELIINRKTELVNFVTLSSVGLSPPLYARFKNGFVYGYIEGRTLTVADMRDPCKYALIARKVASWHKTHLPGKYEPALFTVLWKWLRGVPNSYEIEATQNRFEKSIDKKYLEEQIARLEKAVALLDSPVVFCHNDLLSANIIYKDQPNEVTAVPENMSALHFVEKSNDVAFIDFEYGCHNYRGFDIGNHFSEWAGFECDYTLFPNKEQQLEWLNIYCDEFYNSNNNNTKLTATTTVITTTTVEADKPNIDFELLYKEVNIFALTSHMYWGLWGLVQASFSDIPFDYMGYAIKRFDQYRLTVDNWLES